MKGAKKLPSKIVLVSYPKIIFLYPTFIVSLAAALYFEPVPAPIGCRQYHDDCALGGVSGCVDDELVCVGL